MTLGFQLMGSKTIIQAQARQIQAEKEAVAKIVEKAECEKVNASFKITKSGAKMSCEARFDMVQFLCWD